MKHAAYDLTTGEVLSANRANHLKRCVARTDRWNTAHGYPIGKWVFIHGANWEAKLATKIGA